MRKKLLFVIGGIILAVGIVLGGIKLYRIQDRNQCGILLAFDDYNADNWEGYFDLFDEYGVKATFFICANEPTDFCYDALERGHEIAFHTAGHQELTALSEEEVYQQAIDPIEVFRDGGIELSTFAYPKGSRNEELDEKLLGIKRFCVGRISYRLPTSTSSRRDMWNPCLWIMGTTARRNSMRRRLMISWRISRREKEEWCRCTPMP